MTQVLVKILNKRPDISSKKGHTSRYILADCTTIQPSIYQRDVVFHSNPIKLLEICFSHESFKAASLTRKKMPRNLKNNQHQLECSDATAMIWYDMIWYIAWSAPFVTSCEVVRKLGSFRLTRRRLSYFIFQRIYMLIVDFSWF